MVSKGVPEPWHPAHHINLTNKDCLGFSQDYFTNAAPCVLVTKVKCWKSSAITTEQQHGVTSRKSHNFSRIPTWSNWLLWRVYTLIHSWLHSPVLTGGPPGPPKVTWTNPRLTNNQLTDPHHFIVPTDNNTFTSHGAAPEACQYTPTI